MYLSFIILFLNHHMIACLFTFHCIWHFVITVMYYYAELRKAEARQRGFISAQPKRSPA